MTDSIQKAAMKADGKSHRCAQCPLHPCTLVTFKACTLAFCEEFRKGAAWKTKQLKTKTT